MATKQELRVSIKQKRAAMGEEARKELDAAIIDHIAKTKCFQNASWLLLYAPTRGEINLLPLARIAQKRGKRIAFPRCDTATETMQFYELEPGARLISGAYGIPEPPSEAPMCVPDEHALCILPALTCDPQGNRLGYGKGYYDKFLASFPGLTLCAVYHTLMVRELPAQEHDIPARYLCTEHGVFKTQAPSAQTRETDSASQRRHTKKALPKSKKASLLKLRERMGAWIAAYQRRGATQRDSSMRALTAPPVLVLCIFALLLFSGWIEPYFDRESEYASVILLQVLIFIIPAALYGKLRGEHFFERIRMKLPRPEHLWLTACLLVLMITGSLLMGILTGGIQSLSGNFTLYSVFVAHTGSGAWETVYIILAYAVLPAFGEELVFRSILCAEYERRGVGVSIVVSALFFAMLHFSLPLFLTYFVLGLLLACALYATRSFLTVVLLHLLYNVFCLFGQPYLSAFYVNAGSNEIFVFCLVVLFLLFAAFAAGEARKAYHAYARKNMDSSYTVSVPLRSYPGVFCRAFLSPITLVCVVLWLIVSISNLL